MKKMCKGEESDYCSKEYQKVLVNPKYFCEKCGRPSKNEKKVCKAKKIKKTPE